MIVRIRHKPTELRKALGNSRVLRDIKHSENPDTASLSVRTGTDRLESAFASRHEITTAMQSTKMDNCPSDPS